MNKTFAVFANGGTMTTAQTALWQYDYGQILVVQGIELPNAYEVQFCNAGDSTTITSVGDSTGVVIPDQFLQNGETIYAYIYLHTGDADGETEYKITIPVMDRAEPTDIEPTPAQESTIGQLIDALNAGVEAAEEAAEKGPQIIDGYWHIWDAEAGEYVNTEIQATGADGNSIWTTNQQPFIISTNVGYYYKEQLTGRAGSDPIIGDIVVQSADKVWAVFDFTSAGRPKVQLIGSIKGAPGDPGEDGYSPVVTIAEIDGGHRVTITDEDHPQGQSFDVMDGTGGSGSSDYNDLSNKPSIAGVTLSGNKSLADLGIAAASDIPAVPVQSVNGKTGAVVLNASDVGAGTYSKPSGGIPKSDLAAAVQTSLGKADDALPASGDAYRTASIPMGHLDSTSTATVMTATIPGITELRDGVCVWLKNGVITSASGVTLNINSLGAKPIYNSLSGAIVTTTFAEASTYLFVYNSTRVTGGCWDMVYGYDTNTTYTPAKLGQGYAVCSTAAATAAKTANISSYTLVAGGIVAIKFENDVPANATLNINSKGAKAIYYKGAAITTGVIHAGDTVTMIYSTYYHVISIDSDIPAPFDGTPADVKESGTPGTSAEYARADHVHGFDTVAFENMLKYLYAVNIPVILTDATTGAVLIHASPTVLASEIISQRKVNFALVVPPDTTNYPVLFTASKFSSAGELHLTGIVDGVLYEAVLTPGVSTMTGTMTTTNLALPSAQGVSF